ncbi:FkbM family methyltransferase [Paracoccaceae bacterium Fryx2]|nr:FkbM family methyltransferase [Paracoccaceae bacterium Fryx2]
MESGTKGLLALLAARLVPLRPLRIVDVGANPIDTPVYADLAAAGLAEVWGFEPNPQAFARLMADKPDHAQFLPMAVGIPGRVVLNAYPASEMSSVYKLSRRSTAYLGQFRRHIGTETEIPLRMHALDDIDLLPAIDLLKVDAQGAERDVIAGGRDRLARAVAVVAEMRFYRLYDGEPMLHELDAELRAQGFVLHRFLHQKARMLPHSQGARVNRKTLASQLIDGDAVYIRSLEDKADWSDTQLKHLALLASGIFGSHDLALFCLDQLIQRKSIDAETAADYVDLLPDKLRA